MNFWAYLRYGAIIGEFVSSGSPYASMLFRYATRCFVIILVRNEINWCPAFESSFPTTTPYREF